MTFVDLLVAALAAWQGVEVWRHGSIFARARARLEAAAPESAFGGWSKDLLLCGFCLSVWCGTLAALAMWLGGWWALPAYALAASRLANLFNDLCSPITCTPLRRHGPRADEEFADADADADAGEGDDAGGAGAAPV